MTIRPRKLVGVLVASALCIAGFAAPSAANVPQRDTGSLNCVTDASGNASIAFVPALTGVAAFEGFNGAKVTGASGAEAESLDRGTSFPSTTFVATVAGVEQTIDVEGPPSIPCTVGFAVDAVPTNDAQSAAEVLPGSSGTVDGTTRAATLDLPDEPQPFPDANRVVWYRWTALFSGNMRFEVEPQTGFSSYLGAGTIWTALCLAIYGPANHFTPLTLGGKPVADGLAAYGGLFEVAVTAGTQYDIAVCSGGGTGDFASAFGYTAPGAFTLTWQPVAPLPTIIPRGASIVEGNAGTKTLNIPVALSAPSTQTVTAQWTTLPLTGSGFADGSNDYTPASGAVTFAPGQTRKTVPIVVKGDVTDEPDENVIVSFDSPTNALIGGFYGLGFGVIKNDDPPPTVVPGLASGFEGNVGTSVINVPVSLSAASGRTVTVQWKTLPHPGSDFADAGVDYTPSNGVVTFAPGETNKTVPIVVHGDTVHEPDEFIVVSFHDPTNAVMSGYWGLGFGLIQDDD
jgi:Calx-beta domain